MKITPNRARWVVLTLALPGAPAIAQQYDPFDRLGTLQDIHNPFGRERNVGVAERPRPDYATVPIRAGPLEITPQIVVQADYNDNIFATDSDRVEDAILHFRPRISIVRPSPDLSLSIAAEYDAGRYADNSSENSDEYTIEGRARYVVSNDTTADLRLLQARVTEDRTSPDSLTGIVRPNRFDVSEVYGEVAHTFNRLRLRGTLDYERRNYSDNRLGNGLEVDQDFRNRSTVTGGLIAEYALSPSFAVFGAGSANKRDYNTRIGPLPARDSSGYELALGASFELGRLMRGSLRLGYLSQDYRDPLFDDVDGLLVRGELAYFVTPLVTLTATADRSVVETGVIGAAGYLRTTAALRADYELLRNLIIRAEAGIEMRDFNGIDREDRRFTGSASASYLISPRWALKAEYSNRGQDSTGLVSGRDFDQNRLTVGIVFKGL